MQLINQLINFTWTIAAFSVVIITWYEGWQPWLLIGSLLISIAFLLLPIRLFRFSDRPSFYESLGVRFAARFVQDGSLINRHRRKADPGFKAITRARLRSFVETSLMYERFHLYCLLFFLLTAIQAICIHRYDLAALVIVANLFYNLYPLLLQQYYRLRVSRLNAG